MANKLTKAQLKLLKEINDTVGQYYITKSDDAVKLATWNPPLIEVNSTITNPSDVNQAAARITDAGKAMLGNETAPASVVPDATGEAANQSQFAIINNAELPKSKRRGGGQGAPAKYPFDQLEIGQMFFVPKTDKHPNPAKSLGSTISSKNLDFAVQDGTREVTRTKRGEKNRAVIGPDGLKVKETVMVPVWKYTRKFSIRPVEAGKSYGGWTAPADGALVARIPIE